MGLQRFVVAVAQSVKANHSSLFPTVSAQAFTIFLLSKWLIELFDVFRCQSCGQHWTHSHCGR